MQVYQENLGLSSQKLNIPAMTKKKEATDADGREQIGKLLCNCTNR
jgi:hypothetical protein